MSNITDKIYNVSILHFHNGPVFNIKCLWHKTCFYECKYTLSTLTLTRKGL